MIVVPTCLYLNQSIRLSLLFGTSVSSQSVADAPMPGQTRLSTAVHHTERDDIDTYRARLVGVVSTFDMDFILPFSRLSLRSPLTHADRD